MARTRDATIREVTQTYLSALDTANPPDETVVAADLLEQVNAVLEIENASRPRGQKWQLLTALTAAQIADIIMACYHVVNIDMLAASGGRAMTDQTLLAYYAPSGESEGIYVSDEAKFRQIAKAYSYNITERDLARVMQILHDESPVVKRTDNRDFVPLANGVFDYASKTLLPFSPEYVFIAKAAVGYNPLAVNPTLHNADDGTDWDVESWMQGLSDDPNVVELLWKLIGATLRPFVSWNKAAWFYSETGNNGKGTLCALMKNILGEKAYTSIPLSDFSKEFILEGLTRVSAIITDENDVGVFIDKAANLKAIITGDSILINRKFKNSVSYMFRGMMVQCVNELPRVKDKSESFYRRQLVVPFSKCFTGQERKYIKDEYLRRQDVLEYVVAKVLNMDYYDLPEPAACVRLLSEYREYNDPVRQFVSDVFPQLRWDLLPYTFLYDLYKAWFREASPSGQMQGRNTFVMDLMHALHGNSSWACGSPQAKIRSKDRMNGPEPLIARYNLKEWFNPNFAGHDTDKLCLPPLRDNYAGVQRVVPSGLYIAASDEDDEEEG